MILEVVFQFFGKKMIIFKVSSAISHFTLIPIPGYQETPIGPFFGELHSNLRAKTTKIIIFALFLLFLAE